MSELEVPLSKRTSSPKQIPAEYYYRIPVRPIYKSYPVYGLGKEPAGYLEHLRQLEPLIVFDPTKLKTREDWIKAGEKVFETPTTTGRARLVIQATFICKTLSGSSAPKRHLREMDSYLSIVM